MFWIINMKLFRWPPSEQKMHELCDTATKLQSYFQILQGGYTTPLLSLRMYISHHCYFLYQQHCKTLFYWEGPPLPSFVVWKLQSFCQSRWKNKNNKKIQLNNIHLQCQHHENCKDSALSACSKNVWFVNHTSAFPAFTCTSDSSISVKSLLTAKWTY